MVLWNAYRPVYDTNEAWVGWMMAIECHAGLTMRHSGQIAASRKSPGKGKDLAYFE